MLNAKSLFGTAAAAGAAVALFFSNIQSCMEPAIPELQVIAVPNSQQEPQGQRYFNKAFVTSWGFEGSWNDVAGHTATLKKSTGSGPHAVLIGLSIDGPVRRYEVNENAIVGLLGGDMLLIDNTGHADPFSPEWIGVDNFAQVLSKLDADAALTTTTTYNYSYVVSMSMTGACANTVTVIPIGTAPLERMTDDPTVPPNQEPGDKFQLCSKDGLQDCYVTIELSTGRCWKHRLDCVVPEETAAGTEPGYWHRDVSTGDLIVTGDREAVDCD